jgi:hypothetical protein
MAGLSSVITTEALTQLQKAQSNEGWYIYPIRFGVSETAGTLSIARTIDTVNAEWYEGLVSGRIVQNETDIKFLLEIPPSLETGTKTVAELYIYARGILQVFSADAGTNILTISTALWDELVDGDGIYVESNDTLPSPLQSVEIYYAKKEITSGQIKLYTDKALTSLVDITSAGIGSHKIAVQFLLSIGQPDGVLTYDPDAGSILLRPKIRLSTVDDVNLFQFNYTQAGEIESHNNDPNAHPGLLGKTLMRNIVFDVSVNDGDTVYLETDGKFYQALADGSITETNFAGVRQGNVVIFKGKVEAPGHGLAVGSQLFLDDVTAGGYKTGVTNLLIGLVLDADTLLIDRTLAGATINTSFLSLNDTPVDYATFGGAFLRVNNTEDGVEFNAGGIAGNLTKYDDITALKAVNTTGFLDDQFAFVVGHGIYRLYPSDTQAEDAMYIVEPTVGGGRWRLEVAQFDLQEYLIEEQVGSMQQQILEQKAMIKDLELSNENLQNLISDLEGRVTELENP